MKELSILSIIFIMDSIKDFVDFEMFHFSELLLRLVYFPQLHNVSSNDLKENQSKQCK